MSDLSSAAVESDLPVAAEASTGSYIGLAINVISTFVVSMSVGLNAILFPVTMQSEGFSNSYIGIILSLEVAASLGVCLAVSPILKLINMPVCLIISTFIRVAPLLLLMNMKGVSSWVSMVFMHGVGIFMFLILMQTWANSIPFKKYRGLMVALYSTAISLGVACGPVLYQWLPDLVPMATELWLSQGFKLDNPDVYGGFLVSAFLSAIALLFVLPGFGLIPKIGSEKESKIFPIIKKSQGVMFAITLAGVSFFGVSSFITIYGIKNGLAVEDAALLLTSFMLGSLVLETPLSLLSDFVDRRYVIVFAVLASIVCATFLPITIYEKYQAWALLFVWGGIIGAVYSVALAVIGDTYTGADLVTANAGYSLMEGVGGAAGVVLIGFAVDTFDADGLPYIIMLAGIIYFSYALTRYRIE